MTGKPGRKWQVNSLYPGSRHPMHVYKKKFRAERYQGKGADLYFDDQDAMLAELAKQNGVFTPMVWDEQRKLYTVDFQSANILGI